MMLQVELPMARTLYSTPNGILAAAREAGHDGAAIRQLPGGRALKLLDRIFERFTVGGVESRQLRWLWTDLREPSFSTHRAPQQLLTLLALGAATTRVWLLVEDWAGEKRGPAFWVFDATLEAALGALNGHHLLEFCIVERSFEWLVAENHHNVLFAVGDHAIATLRTLSE